MPKFYIGDVVTLNSHPFSTETTDVIISGEYLMIPPLMIIVEIIDHSVIASDKDNQNKYKCVWFSTKKNHFQESYFTEFDIKYVPCDKGEEPIKIGEGCLVTLATADIELGKRRSFLNTETTQGGESKSSNSVIGLLSFISPVMTVIEIKDFDISKDKKTSADVKPKKTYPSRVAKCKWFDAVNEKFSECIIAVEALSVLPATPNKLLKEITQVITDGQCVELETTIVRPIQITNRSGKYYLNCFDYVAQRNSTISFNQLLIKAIIKNPIKTEAPHFELQKKKRGTYLKLMKDVPSLIENAIKRSQKKIIIIKYEDNLKVVTFRAISNYRIISGDDWLKKGEITKYVRAYCHLRNAERNFRLESIQRASELKINCPASASTVIT